MKGVGLCLAVIGLWACEPIERYDCHDNFHGWGRVDLLDLRDTITVNSWITVDMNMIPQDDRAKYVYLPEGENFEWKFVVNPNASPAQGDTSYFDYQLEVGALLLSLPDVLELRTIREGYRFRTRFKIRFRSPGRYTLDLRPTRKYILFNEWEDCTASFMLMSLEPYSDLKSAYVSSLQLVVL